MAARRSRNGARGALAEWLPSRAGTNPPAAESDAKAKPKKASKGSGARTRRGTKSSGAAAASKSSDAAVKALARRLSAFEARLDATEAVDERLARLEARWNTGSSLRGPSAFLTEVRDACAALGGAVAAVSDGGWAPAPAEGDTNPLDAEPRERQWPQDPLSAGRRVALERGVQLVRAAAERTQQETQDPDLALSPAELQRDQEWDDEVAKLLAERARLREASTGAVEVALPDHLSVSQLIALHRDPEGLARWIRRPVPLPPAPLARRGTAFHTWLERRFQGGRLLDLDELPGAADAEAALDADLDVLKDAFLASEWAERQPIEVEVPFETLVDGVPVRGRADAVFRETSGAPGPDFIDVVVDWKTGRVPTGADATAAAVQLAAYRLAWHRLSGTPLERIAAAFHYVRAGVTVRPVDLLDADGLIQLIRQVPFSAE